MADLKQLARQIFLETLAAIDIPAAMERKLLREGSLLRCDDAAIALSAFTKFRVVAIGKAAHAMLDGLRSLLPREIAFEGIACAPAPPPQPVQGIDYFAGGHPIPNQQDECGEEARLRSERRPAGGRRATRHQSHARRDGRTGRPGIRAGVWTDLAGPGDHRRRAAHCGGIWNAREAAGGAATMDGSGENAGDPEAG